MTRRTLWASCLTIVAALVAWALISREAGSPGPAGPSSEGIAALEDAPQGSGPASAAADPVNSARATPAHDASDRAAFARRTNVYAEAAAADETRLATLIEQARTIPDANERIATLAILLLKLAERDAPAAVRGALASNRADALHLIGTLASGAPEAVWTALAQVDDPLARVELQSAVLEAWTMRDPERAFRTAAALPQGWAREQLMREATSGVARRDPQAALELVKTLPAFERDALYGAIADHWARNDPRAAAQWIERLPVRKQAQLAYQISGPFVAQQPEEALAWALKISRTPSRQLWSHMIGLIAARDPQEALRLAQAAENPAQRAQATARAIAAIAARDPALATTYLHKLPYGDARSEALAQVGMQIARTRPDLAIDWLRELGDYDMDDDAASAMAAELASADVESAARMIDRVPKDARRHWAREVALAYADSAPEGGVDWVRTWRDEDPELVTTYMHRVAMRNPDEALALVDRVADENESDQVTAHVLGMLAFQSPEAAARQMGRIQDEPTRIRTAQGLGASWSRHDAEAASKWARSLESGRVRDSALSGVATHVHDFDDLLEVIGDIQSPEYQTNAVFSAATRRGYTDPESMRALLRRYPLDPQRQQQLDSMLRARRR